MLVAGIMLLIIAIIISINVITNDDSNFVYTIIGSLIAILVLSGIALLQEYFDPSISPMDVYKGKTTLEITYRDSIAIDSTVVWKEVIK